MSQRILITGATGNVGREVVRILHEQNWPFRAAVISEKDAQNLPIPDTEWRLFDFGEPDTYTAALEGVDRLTILQGDVTNADQVEEAVANAEAVISVLGPTSNKPDYMVSQGMNHIIAAMDVHGVRRLVVSAGAGVSDPNDDPKLTNKVIGFLVRTFSRYVYEDMVRTVEAVRGSDLDWTIVRVPMLTDDAPKGDVKVAYVGKGMGSRITQADMAAFMLNQVEDDTYLHQAPAISN